jgi:type I restriction enzyme, S subunit
MSWNVETTIPTGRKKIAPGNALGNPRKNTSSPEGAKENGELPKGWRRVAIKDMADSIQYGLTASAAERQGGPRFLRITDIQEGRVDWSTVPSCDIPKEQISKYRLSSGDLVFARTGATTGKSFLIGECPEAVFASYLIRVRVSADVDSRYLSAFFQSPDYWRQIEGGKRGIGQPNVNGTVLGEVQFPLAPPDEQRRIVAEIEKQFTRLEAGVAALRRVQANLKRYRAAVLKAACEGRLVPTEAELRRTADHADGTDKKLRKSASSAQSAAKTPAYETGAELLARILTERRKIWQGRGKYKEPASPDMEKLPQLPEGWAVGSVDQLSGHITSGSRDWSQFYDKGTGTFILAQNVRPMRLDLNERQAVDAPKGDAETERTRVQQNDILITIVGAKTGDVCRVPSGLKDHFVCQSIALLRPVLPGVAKFAEMYLASQENGQAQWKR